MDIIPKVMTTQTFEEIRETIYVLSGIFYTDNKKYLLEANLIKRMKERQIFSFEEYHKLIKNKSEKKELLSFYDAITINETFFFREDVHFDLLEKEIIPGIIKNKPKILTPTIKIWSAASSTGEEPYTIALIVKEKLMPKFPGVNFEIIGTDISSAVITAAHRGIYRDYSIRNIPKYYLEKYFIKTDNLYALRNDIKSLVKFQNINLYDSYMMSMQKNFDLIFCRNVLIYFDTTSKEKVVRYLHGALTKSGILIIGVAESLNHVKNEFKQKSIGKAIFYIKE